MSIILITISFVLLFVYLVRQLRRPPNFPPGPLWLPYVGNLLYIKKLTKSLGGLHRALSYLAQKYHTNILGLKLGKEYVVTVFEYPLIKEVFTREEFQGRPNNFFFKMRSFGRPNSGITGSDGAVHTTNRNFVARHFREQGFGKRPMETMVRNEVKEFLEFLNKNGTNIQIAKFFSPKVLNIIWALVNGRRISGDDKTLDELLDLFAVRGKMMDVTGGILNQMPWMRFIAPKWTGYSLIQEINGKLRNMILKMIKEHYETWEEDKRDDLIYSYITEINKAGPGSLFCEEELVAICFDLFLGGTQTTSGTLELVFFKMIQYPEVQRKVQEEIDAKLDKNAVLDFEDAIKLPYTNAVLLETTRHSPVLPVIGPRRATRATTLGGYNLPEGTSVYINYFSMFHNEQEWSDPDVFKPERFLDENGELITPECFVPFALGKRKCFGNALAKQCLFYFFVEVFRNFNVTLASDSAPLSGSAILGLTLVPPTYTAKFTKRF